MTQNSKRSELLEKSQNASRLATAVKDSLTTEIAVQTGQKRKSDPMTCEAGSTIGSRALPSHAKNAVQTSFRIIPIIAVQLTIITSHGTSGLRIQRGWCGVAVEGFPSTLGMQCRNEIAVRSRTTKSPRCVYLDLGQPLEVLLHRPSYTQFERRG